MFVNKLLEHDWEYKRFNSDILIKGKKYINLSRPETEMDIEIKEEKRWLDIDAVLKRPSKFAPEEFTPGDEVVKLVTTMH